MRWRQLDVPGGSNDKRKRGIQLTALASDWSSSSRMSLHVARTERQTY